jgi:predicted house-cleaning noncanonical NTP pyrophosphatase (MazG superfamily)
MGKLVRDKIPDIIRGSGRTADVRQLDDRAYLAALYEKLAEEAAELRRANNADNILEEAADVLEVLISLAALHGHTLDDIVRVASEKRSERGGFDKRLWLECP